MRARMKRRTSSAVIDRAVAMWASSSACVIAAARSSASCLRSGAVSIFPVTPIDSSSAPAAEPRTAASSTSPFLSHNLRLDGSFSKDAQRWPRSHPRRRGSVCPKPETSMRLLPHEARHPGHNRSPHRTAPRPPHGRLAAWPPKRVEPLLVARFLNVELTSPEV
jgi:hypothetical protein